MTPLSECSQWHAEQARLCASKAVNLRHEVFRGRAGFNTALAQADALELMAAKHRLWARSCAEADTDEPYVRNGILVHHTVGTITSEDVARAEGRGE